VNHSVGPFVVEDDPVLAKRIQDQVLEVILAALLIAGIICIAHAGGCR
jgi:hypothetical protein